MHKIIEKIFQELCPVWGHIIIVNLHTDSSDNCVFTVQPQYLPQHLSPLANLSLKKERKKENTLESQGGVQLRMQYYV